MIDVGDSGIVIATELIKYIYQIVIHVYCTLHLGNTVEVILKLLFHEALSVMVYL